MPTVPVEPKAPADAYAVMADHLGPAYFETQPPNQGALLEVVGRDGVATEWAMDIRQAQGLMEPLRLDHRVIRIVPSRYETLKVA